MRTELGYVFKDDNTKLFPKTLGRGVQYNIEESYFSKNKESLNP